MILAILNTAQHITIWLQSLLQTRQHILTLGLAVNHQHKGLTAVLMHATAILLDKVHDRLNVKFLEGALLIERRRKQHYLRLQQELQRNQAEIYKMYESIEAKRDNGALMREQVLVLYRANLSKSTALFHREEWHTRLQKLSEQRSKDIPPFTIKERKQLAEVLEQCFITVITNTGFYIAFLYFHQLGDRLAHSHCQFRGIV